MPVRLQLAADLPAPPIDRTPVAVPAAARWPFIHPFALTLAASPACMVVPDLHEAFENHQTAATRLVTTQATYRLLEVLQAVGTGDLLIVASADHASLRMHAPEILARRGIFGQIEVEIADDADTVGDGAAEAPAGPVADAPPVAASPSASPDPTDTLIAAFRAPDPGARLALCVRALDQARTPAALLAAASVCMEVNDLEASARDLDAAIAAAPGWAAAHFERGKLWLRQDDMARAAEAFRTAATLMPAFGSAWSNLGAALGELDRQAEALEAFAQARTCDPESVQTLNNIGVLHRERGELADSESAFKRVVELAPELAFGYYNLGHTLFLQGRYQAALAAYLSGQKRDPEGNAVQATRLAMCQLATGDSAGAVTTLRRATAAMPREYKRQVLADTQTIAWALLVHRPELPGWQDVNRWLTQELAT